jgi:hypothetical protein
MPQKGKMWELGEGKREKGVRGKKFCKKKRQVSCDRTLTAKIPGATVCLREV